MHAFALRHFVLIAGCLAAAPALAGVGATSSGVSSTVGTQGTNASPEVQQQSAGFVQQNQQLQEGQNPIAPNGIVVPGGVANAATGGAKGAPNSANTDAKGNPADAANAQAAAPVTPPPPPPTYVSAVKHLTPSQATAGTPATTVAVVPVAVPTPPAVTPDAAAKADPSPAPSKVAAPAPPPAAVANAPVANNPADTSTAANAKVGATERGAETGVISGGRGPAPDGYTFYVGFGIALLLLAIAFAAYLSSQKDEAARRPPG
jgi:hypothetical protein